MSGIRFCSECLNILHPEEEKNEHRLLFVCKSCDYREYIQDPTSMEENKIYQRDFMQSFTEAFIDPDYCLDPTLPREKVICPNCRYTECCFLIDREPGDKFLRKIYVCGRLTKAGKPDCKSVFTALKYAKVSTKETYAYREYGTANEVLVMLHGNMTSSYIFEKAFAKLAEGFRIIVPDLRGFGFSSYANKLNNFDELVEDVKNLLGDLKITKPVVLGWDIGAAVALKFAAKNPGEIEKLILVNPVGLTGKTYIKDPYDDTNPIPEWPEDNDEIMKDNRVIEFTNALKDKKKDFFRNYFTDEVFTMRVPENDRLEAYIENFINQRNLPEIIACMNRYDISENGTNEVYQVQTETLILCGANDYKTPANEALELKNALGEIATLKTFEDCGHALIEDNTEEFIQCVAEFCLGQMEEDL